MTRPIFSLIVALVAVTLVMPAFGGEPFAWKFGQRPSLQSLPFGQFNKGKQGKKKNDPAPAPVPSTPAVAYDWALLKFTAQAIRTRPNSSETYPFFEYSITNAGSVATPTGRLVMEFYGADGKMYNSKEMLAIRSLAPGESLFFRTGFDTSPAYQYKGHMFKAIIVGPDGNRLNNEMQSQNFQP